MVQYGGKNLRDSTEFLNKLSRRFPKETILTSFVITCLYTNIPHNVGMEAIQYWLTKYLPSTAGRFSQEFIVEGKKIILQNNTFTFNDRTFLQIKGTALWTKMAPSYATLVLGYLKNTMYEDTTRKFGEEIDRYIQENWLRYLDDCYTPPPQLNII